MKSSVNAAFLASLGVCGGGLALRLAFTHSIRGAVLATGGVALEAGVLAYLKPKGAAFEEKLHDWLMQRQTFRRATAFLDAAKAELAQRLELLTDTEREIASIEERDLKGRVFGANPQLARSLAETAARRGVIEQIAINRIQNVVPGER